MVHIANIQQLQETMNNKVKPGEFESIGDLSQTLELLMYTIFTSMEIKQSPTVGYDTTNEPKTY